MSSEDTAGNPARGDMTSSRANPGVGAGFILYSHLRNSAYVHLIVGLQPTQDLMLHKVHDGHLTRYLMIAVGLFTG